MFSEIKDYGAVFETLVTKTADYLIQNNIKAQILGISGGIDSAVVAAICYEVSILTGIPLIGRSLPTHFNKESETITADLVGKAFCTNYQEVSIEQTYKTLSNDLYGYECALDFNEPQPTVLTNGNIQARLRMIYLYNLAGMYKGLVMDTDNLTENNLGYFTIHGDVGDFNPIGGLWKTEVFELAGWIHNYYYKQYVDSESEAIYLKTEALKYSISLKPTAGLGITNNDLEELGAESYEQVDAILQEILAWKQIEDQNPINPEERYKRFVEDQQMLNIPIEVIQNVAKRHFYSSFKRKRLPIKINRETII